MTEEEWLACTDLTPMLAFLRGKASERKCRLLLVAWWRRRFGNMRTFEAFGEKLAQAEEMADGNWRPKRGQAGWIGHQKNGHYQAVRSVKILAGLRGKGHVSLEAQAALVRDIFGNPFHPSPPLPPAVLAWNEDTVRRLAQAVYEERPFPAGTLDAAGLAVLADALEEAGCTDADLLAHCRQPGGHVRGCWPVDLILGKS